MYNDLVNIVITFLMISWVQSYDYFLKVVSVAYGKDKSKRKRETATNQYIMKSSTRYPMEKMGAVAALHHGKGGEGGGLHAGLQRPELLHPPVPQADGCHTTGIP